MSSATDYINNTILIPNKDGLVSSSPLPENSVAADLAKVKESKWNINDIEDTWIKVNGGASKKITGIQRISEFGMSRENQQQRMGDYVINLPGRIEYDDVTISHLFTRDDFFLDWITNGINKGGVSRADIEIHIDVKNEDNQEMVFTLCDAFPVKWDLMKKLTVTHTESDEDVLCEDVTLAYSKITFKKQKKNAS